MLCCRPSQSAAKQGNVEVVRLLLEYGGLVDIKDEEGDTPLDVAKKEGREEVVEVLQEDAEETK